MPLHPAPARGTAGFLLFDSGLPPLCTSCLFLEAFSRSTPTKPFPVLLVSSFHFPPFPRKLPSASPVLHLLLQELHLSPHGPSFYHLCVASKQAPQLLVNMQASPPPGAYHDLCIASPFPEPKLMNCVFSVPIASALGFCSHCCLPLAPPMCLSGYLGVRRVSPSSPPSATLLGCMILAL